MSTEHQEVVMKAVSQRIRAAEASLNMIDEPDLLEVRGRQHQIATVRRDLNVAKAMLTLYKRHLGSDLTQLLVGEMRVIEDRAISVNIHPAPPMPEISKEHAQRILSRPKPSQIPDLRGDISY